MFILLFTFSMKVFYKTPKITLIEILWISNFKIEAK